MFSAVLLLLFLPFTFKKSSKISFSLSHQTFCDTEPHSYLAVSYVDSAEVNIGQSGHKLLLAHCEI